MSFSYTTDPSGIKFNNIPESGTKGLNYKPQYGDNDFEYADEDGVTPFINAVEIDWNGASLGNEITDSATLTTGEQILINTTGQLLSYMSVISQKITNLENILMNL